MLALCLSLSFCLSHVYKKSWPVEESWKLPTKGSQSWLQHSPHLYPQFTCLGQREVADVLKNEELWPPFGRIPAVLLALIKLFLLLKQMTAESCLLSLILSEMQQINPRPASNSEGEYTIKGYFLHWNIIWHLNSHLQTRYWINHVTEGIFLSHFSPRSFG